MDDNGVGKKILPVTSVTNGDGKFARDDLFCLPIQIVNVCFIGKKGANEWVLVDAGMPKSAEMIIKEAESLYGKGVAPKAIILTHGHFDHIGAIVELVEHWKSPVYAHSLEMPYLTGIKDYPKPDPTVEGGMVAKMSGMFPNKGINLENHIHQLPADGSIPDLPDWEWVHTPGHTPGHISLFRKSDGALLAGDAFVTVKQENLYKVITQEKEFSGPPRYLTTDWAAAKKSVQTLEQLHPTVAITGHGVFVEGNELAAGLRNLSENFDSIAKPDYGKYVDGKDTQ